jgi:hypothetical protein
MVRNVLLAAVVLLGPSAWAADTASVSTALPASQPAGCDVNRWMPFWVDIKGSFSFDSGPGCDGFELWLEYDPAQIEPDLDGYGLDDAYTYTGTVFDGLWTPDFTGITKETRTISTVTHYFLRIGVNFDTATPSDKVLATPQTAAHRSRSGPTRRRSGSRTS